MKNFLYSILSFIIALFFVFLGVISILIPWAPKMKAHFIRFLLENSIAISLFGLCFVVIGLFTAINILLSSRRRYYEFTVGFAEVQVDEELIQKYLHVYFQELFPAQEVPCLLDIKQNLLHITADLPFVAPSQRDLLIEKLQQDVKDLLSKYIGYHSDYYLSVSFQSDKAD